jgi:hypothetical protein
MQLLAVTYRLVLEILRIHMIMRILFEKNWNTCIFHRVTLAFIPRALLIKDNFFMLIMNMQIFTVNYGLVLVII